MKYTHHIGMRVIISAMLGVACLASVTPMAYCQSHCQSYWTAAYKCSQGCGSCADTGNRGGSTSAPSYDDGAARRAQEAAADAERQRQAEADRIERERLAKEKREKDERDAQFIRDRDATASTLRGTSIGTRASPNDGGLRGSSTVDTGLRELRGGDRGGGDLQGPQAAWKQLHCAAALSGYAFAAVSKPTPDYQESSFLLGQASKAMAGEPLNVECGKAPAMPGGRAVDWDKLRQTQQRMIERTATLSERIRAGQQARARYEPTRTLTPDEQRIQEVYRQQQENQARIAQRDAPVIAAQNAINRAQERRYNPQDAAAIREEQKAKAELDKYVDASKKLENGDPSAMLNLGIAVEATATRPRRQSVAAP
jgi:hypothetical protein